MNYYILRDDMQLYETSNRWMFSNFKYATPRTNRGFVNPPTEYMEPRTYPIDLFQDGVETDFNFTRVHGIPILSEKAKKALAGLPEIEEPRRHVVIEPVWIDNREVVSNYYVMIVETQIDCVDEGKSPGISASHSDYDSKIPGTYGLYVDAEKMKRTVSTTAHAGFFHDYPVDARKAFEQSTHATFGHLFERIKKVDDPVLTSDLRLQGLDGVIVIQVESFESGITVYGFRQYLYEADTEITTNIQFVGHKGNLLDASIKASASRRHGAGFAGAGGSVAVSKSVELAMKETMTRLGEHLANSIRGGEVDKKS